MLTETQVSSPPRLGPSKVLEWSLPPLVHLPDATDTKINAREHSFSETLSADQLEHLKGKDQDSVKDRKAWLQQRWQKAEPMFKSGYSVADVISQTGVTDPYLVKSLKISFKLRLTHQEKRGISGNWKQLLEEQLEHHDQRLSRPRLALRMVTERREARKRIENKPENSQIPDTVVGLILEQVARERIEKLIENRRQFQSTNSEASPRVVNLAIERVENSTRDYQEKNGQQKLPPPPKSEISLLLTKGPHAPRVTEETQMPDQSTRKKNERWVTRQEKRNIAIILANCLLTSFAILGVMEVRFHLVSEAAKDPHSLLAMAISLLGLS